MKTGFPTIKVCGNYFSILRGFFGSHVAASEYLGVSYSRYNQWRWGAPIPAKDRRLLELAVWRIKEAAAETEREA